MEIDAPKHAFHDLIGRILLRLAYVLVGLRSWPKIWITIKFDLTLSADLQIQTVPKGSSKLTVKLEFWQPLVKVANLWRGYECDGAIEICIMIFTHKIFLNIMKYNLIGYPRFIFCIPFCSIYSRMLLVFLSYFRNKHVHQIFYMYMMWIWFF